MGKGIMCDHASGIVIGETAVIGDNCSLLHGVTLGGTGNEKGDRHPKIGRGVMIGAGAKILGSIKVGDCARIAAGSVVLKDVPPRRTVAGVPGREVGVAGCEEPALVMEQILVCDDHTKANSDRIELEKARSHAYRRDAVTRDEIIKLERYLKKVFRLPELQVRQRPQKDH